MLQFIPTIVKEKKIVELNLLIHSFHYDLSYAFQFASRQCKEFPEPAPR